MATRNISITDKLDRFVEDQVQSGDYQNASEVVRAGLRLLQRQDETYQRKLQTLADAAQTGIAALDAGDFEPVEDSRVWMDSLEAEVLGRG